MEIYNSVKEKLQQNKQIALDSIEVYKKDRAKRSKEIANENRMINSKIKDSIKIIKSRMLLKKKN